LYHDSRGDNLPIGASILLIVVIVAVMLGFVSCYAGNKEANAREHAEQLGLKNYKIHCDNTPWACGCTITWEVEYGQRTEKFACCGWGCE
jgi:hypothetical protein